MGNNCLFVQANEGVAGQDFRKFDIIRIQVTVAEDANSSQRHCEIPATPIPYSLTIDDPDKVWSLYSGGTTKTVSSSPSAKTTFIAPKGTYIVEISNKYAFTGVNSSGTESLSIAESASNNNNVIKIYAKELSYATKFKFIKGLDDTAKKAVFVGDIKYLSNCKDILYFSADGSIEALTGDISELDGNKFKIFSMFFISTLHGTTTEVANVLDNSTYQLRLYYCYNSIIGDISAFNGILGISNLTFAACRGLTGNIDNLFTAWSTAGKTGTCKCYIGNFEGQALAGDVYSQYLNAVHTVTFNGDGTWSVS